MANAVVWCGLVYFEGKRLPLAISSRLRTAGASSSACLIFGRLFTCHNTIQYNTIQYKIQYNTVQYNITQYNTTQ